MSAEASRTDNLCSAHLTAPPPHRSPSLSVKPSSGAGPLLLAGYEDGSVLLWDVTQRSQLSQTKAHPEPVMCLTFDPERLRGISGSSEKDLCSWTVDGQNNLQVSSRQESFKSVNQQFTDVDSSPKKITNSNIFHAKKKAL